MKLTPKQEKWLALAINPDRPNLSAVYRDKNHFVSCNGHILHAIKTPIKDKPHYPCGLKESFPDNWYRNIKESKIYYNYPPEIITELKKAIKILYQFLRNTGTPSSNAAIKMHFYPHKIICESFGYDGEGRITIGDPKIGGYQSSLGISPKYLLQALYEPTDDNLQTIFGFTNNTSPLIIKNKLDGLETIAAITPMRTE